MGLLTTNARNALPDDDFAEPKARKFPIENASHAANAKARATQQVKAGKMAPSTASKIKAKANRVIKAKG
jgi:hypothetical protein